MSPPHRPLPLFQYTAGPHASLAAFKEHVVVRGTRPAMEEGWPPALREVLTQCWDPRGDRRPAFRDVQTTFQALVDDVRARKGGAAGCGGNSSALLGVGK